MSTLHARQEANKRVDHHECRYINDSRKYGVISLHGLCFYRNNEVSDAAASCGKFAKMLLLVRVVLCMEHVLEDGKYEPSVSSILCKDCTPADWNFSRSSIQNLFSLTFRCLFSCQSVSPLSSCDDFIHEFQALHHLRFPTRPRRLVSPPAFRSCLSSKRVLWAARLLNAAL